MKLLNILATILAIAVSVPSHAQDQIEDAHITIENPADLTKQQANDIYATLQERMAESYALSKETQIVNYQSWTRYNTAPYLSATHGQRFVNNYANEIGKDYGVLKEGQLFPKGTVLAKDSITVTDKGKSYMGALFVMEKLGKGASPDTADWRYQMILPDGTLYGDTLGEEPEQVQYCHSCHEAKAEQDYVFYIPEEYRSTP